MSTAGAEWPSDGYIRDICKIGQGAACCRYLTMGPDGWSCEKTTSLKALLDARVAEGSMNARGDNCPGQETRHGA